MSEKNKLIKKIKWANFELTAWDNEYTYEGRQIPSIGYQIGHNVFDKEESDKKGKTVYKTLSYVKMNKIYDLSIINFFMERCKNGKIKAKEGKPAKESIFTMNQYSIERNEEGHYEIKNHYKTKEGAEGETCLILKFRHDILHVCDLLERSLAILIKPSKLYQSENSASNMPNDSNDQQSNEGEFVDETQDDDIPF